MTPELLMAVLVDLEDGRKFQGYPREIVAAVLEAVAADTRPPVFGSRDEDAAVLALWAWRESRLNPHAVNATGRSFGAWQQSAACGRAPTATQARCELWLFHEGVRLCPAQPGAIAWGACHARDVLTGRDVADLAEERVARARVALVRARRSLPAPPP